MFTHFLGEVENLYLLFCTLCCIFLLLFYLHYVAGVPTLGMGGFPCVESSSPFTAPLSGCVCVLPLRSACMVYKCKCVKQLFKLT